MASLRPTTVAGAARRFLLLLGVGGLAGVLVAGLVLPVTGALGLAARSSAEAFQQLPSELVTHPQPQRSVILDADGNVITTFFEQNRVYVGLDQIAPVMKQAMLAIEDARFYQHGPIDLQGTSRSAVRNIVTGEITGGGSTLTQQYVKNVLVSQAETPEQRAAAKAPNVARKIRELRLAIAAERQFTKDEILERYLNISYYGGGAHGIEAAARHFFSVGAGELNLTQAATLAGLVQAPSKYSPSRNPSAAIGRRNIVLTRMADVGMITQADAAKARQEPLNLAVTQTPNGCGDTEASFFCQYVWNDLRAWEGLGADPDEREQAVLRGGLTIKTTLDPKVQGAAQKAISDRVSPTDRAIGAIAMVEPGTGKIKGIAQSRPFGTDKGAGQSMINYAVDVDRGGAVGPQPGSTMKVFVLAAAIQQGIPLSTTIDAPLTINMDGPFRTCNGFVRDRWPVRSSTGTGVLNIWQGTFMSNNTFYAQLEQRTGLCDPVKIATAAGLTQTDGSPLQQVKSFVLGVDQVSPLGIAEAYATFAAEGVHCDSIAVTEILDRDGKQLPVRSPNCTPIMEKAHAQTVTAVLQGVMTQGTGRPAQIGRPAAGKTGTTNDTRSVWFTGYTPQLAASVTVADVDVPLDGLTGVVLNGRRYNDVCGGCVPGPIWKQAMQDALAGVPHAGFAAPDPGQVPSLRLPDPNPPPAPSPSPGQRNRP
jgi:membrane peptidoglycan carboxypeptidase